MKKNNIDNNYEYYENKNLHSNLVKFIKIYFKNKNYKEIICFKVNIHEKIINLINRYKEKLINDKNNYTFFFNFKQINLSSTLSEEGLTEDSEIIVVPSNETLIQNENFDIVSTGNMYKKEINIKFLKHMNLFYSPIYDCQLNGLLKLCLLKEIASILTDERSKKLDVIIYYMMRILANGYINQTNTKNNIKEILEKIKGTNIINFSNYVEELIDENQMKNILDLLYKNEFLIMNDIRFRLSKYNKYMNLFKIEFEKNKRQSIFEFSVISIVIIERQDLEKFEKERNNCPNRVDRILYHGTSIEPISCILINLYRISVGNQKAINGDGVYFTDLLDYAWYYGGKDNRINCNRIPFIDETFTVIVNIIYYDKNGFKHVIGRERNPSKNQINFAYSGAKTEIIKQPDSSKFYANEYVINDLDQICPLMCARLKRLEFCVIWRDINFSSKQIYNNEYDIKFKKFLKDRINYIHQHANYNIYTCSTTEEALKLVKRKKYNKIILISNVGDDFGGKVFIDNARKIIGNDVISLFLAYNISHLNWIKTYKNAIFSNEPQFYEEYLKCFEGNNRKTKLNNLIKRMESHYAVKFNFDDNYLSYPFFKKEGHYDDLTF